MSGSRLEATERSLTKNSGLWLWLNSCSTFSNSSSFKLSSWGVLFSWMRKHQTPMFILFLNGQEMFTVHPPLINHMSPDIWGRNFRKGPQHRLNPAFFVSTLLCQSCHVVIKTIGTKQLHLAWFLQITKHHGNHLLSATPCNREKVERWPNFSPRPILCRLILAHALQIGV